jgi:hypothetical protein
MRLLKNIDRLGEVIQNAADGSAPENCGQAQDSGVN